MNLAPGPDDALGLVGKTIEQVRFDACTDAGGFGLIYRGFHEGLGETVAIKCLRIASIQKTNEQIREALAGRFRDETKLLYRLSQGNLDIVRCIGSGTLMAPRTNEYTPYMVLEWLDGCTLSAELRERRERRLRPRTLDAAVALLDSAAGGIAYAHAHDVVHRDVKPGNLFLTRTREGVRMKVLDFGLAKILSDESIGVRPSVETGVGVHFCSPSYGAPEQYTSQVGKIGPWTDVYSLTLVLLEVMTGEKVRPASTLADGLLKALDPQTGSPKASSLGLQLPRAVEELLHKAVAQNPADRPHDVGAFWSALKAAIAASPKPNLAMATVLDDGVSDAMQQVRAQVASAAGQPAPFTGTMLMENAPSGAPHLVVAVPIPAAGRRPEAATPAVSTSTSPLHAPAQLSTLPLEGSGSVPPAPGPASIEQARARGDRLKGTLPIGALTPAMMPAASPLAASMATSTPLAGGSGPPPPFGGAPQHGQPHAQQPSQQPPPQNQSQQSQPPQAGSYPPPRGARTDLRMGDASMIVPKHSNLGAIVFVVVCLALAIGGAVFYFVRARGG